MKKFGGTWIFGLLVICLAAYVVLDFSNQVERGDLQEGEIEILKDLNRSQVNMIDIQMGEDHTKIQFVKGQCEIVEPVKDQCDPIAIDGLFSQLDSLKGNMIDSTSIDASQMGLNPGQGTHIQLRFENGKTSEFYIGEKNSFDGGFYLKWNDSYYVSSATTSQLTNKTSKQFRDHHVWRGGDDFDQIQVRLDFEGMKERYTLNKSNGLWSSLENDGRILSQDKIEEWLKFLKDLRATDILDNKEIVAASAPSMEITFSKAGEVQYKLDVVKNSIVDSKTNRVLSVTEGLLRRVRVPQSYFFDGKAPFQFPIEEATKILITKNTMKVELSKEGSEWTSKTPKGELTVEELPDFFSEFKKLQALVYYKPQKWFGLDEKDQKRLQIISSDGKRLLDMTWGGKFKVHQGPFKDQEIRYVQLAGQKYTLGVLAKQLDDFLSFNFSKEEKPDDHVH